jgi:hypothetical protein
LSSPGIAFKNVVVENGFQDLKEKKKNFVRHCFLSSDILDMFTGYILYCSVADPYHFDADPNPDPSSEKT